MRKQDRDVVAWEAHSTEVWGEPALGSAIAAGGFWKSLGSTRLPLASGSSTWAPKPVLHLPPGMLFFSVSLCRTLFLVSPGTDAPSSAKDILMDCPLTPCSLSAPLYGHMRPCLCSSLSWLLAQSEYFVTWRALCLVESRISINMWRMNNEWMRSWYSQSVPGQAADFISFWKWKSRQGLAWPRGIS